MNPIIENDEYCQEPVFDEGMSDGVKWFIRGALHSRFNAQHWFRYLSKMVNLDGSIKLSQEEIDQLYNNNQLTIFQKVTLKRATVIGTPTHEYVWSMNKPARLKMLEEFVKIRKEQGQYTPIIQALDEKLRRRNEELGI